MAVSIRLMLLILMAATDHWIPDHNAGNDVSRFDIRAESNCFCLQGLACDPDWKTYARSQLKRDCVKLGSSQQRFLSRFFLQPMTKWDSARFLTLALDLRGRKPGGVDDPFLESEQAHAFFPFFPLLIRQGALLLTKILPKAFLPPTFEGVLVLSVLWINIITFSIALMCLVDLTLLLTPPSDKAVCMAGTVATLFCLNPASIFFASSYTESLFAMCTFAGYALYTRGHSYLAVIPWMAASYTRSNGCLIAAWLIIQGFAKTLQSQRSTLNRVGSLPWHLLLSTAVVAPIVIHDRTGYALHCHRELQPDWCLAEKGSFYGYVQRRHWNVGFLRYYELKQIPNFLLAAPDPNF
jgi:phosphatidylinositol glycan class V